MGKKFFEHSYPGNEDYFYILNLQICNPHDEKFQRHKRIGGGDLPPTLSPNRPTPLKDTSYHFTSYLFEHVLYIHKQI